MQPYQKVVPYFLVSAVEGLLVTTLSSSSANAGFLYLTYALFVTFLYARVHNLAVFQ